jgi:ABC-2 type transport system permease protein
MEKHLKNHVGFLSGARQTLVFSKRALIKMRRNPEQFADITIMPIMFTVMFTFVFGGAIAGSVANYLPIIIPGILVQTFITSCSVSASQIREDMDKSTARRFKAMPIARIAPMAGILVSDLVRFAIAGTITFLVGFALGYRPEAGFFAVVAAVLFMMVIGWCLSWLFAWVGVIAKSASSATAIAMLFMFPLTFISNAFVRSDTMPKPMQFFVDHINPVSKAVSAVREILTYGMVGADFWFALLGAAAILAIFIPLALRSYTRKI